MWASLLEGQPLSVPAGRASGLSGLPELVFLRRTDQKTKECSGHLPRGASQVARGPDVPGFGSLCPCSEQPCSENSRNCLLSWRVRGPPRHTRVLGVVEDGSAPRQGNGPQASQASAWRGPPWHGWGPEAPHLAEVLLGSLGFRVTGGHGAAQQTQVVPGLMHQPAENRGESGPSDAERLPGQRLRPWVPPAHACPSKGADEGPGRASTAGAAHPSWAGAHAPVRVSKGLGQAPERPDRPLWGAQTGAC